MPAQTIKEVKLDEARALISAGKRIAENTYGIPSKNITITVKQSTRPGYVRLVIANGCVC